MANFLEYNPEQAYLLPPTVREVLGEGHLCFFVHGAVEKLDLQEFATGYSDEGHPAYHPALLLKVWLYTYALGMTSPRRLEQRIREDLAFRYLAGGAQPDVGALNEFRKRPGRAMNDIFTQVGELARVLGLGKVGQVAIDSTRLAAHAATSATETLEKRRAERAKIRKNIRRWQQQCASEDPNEGAGLEVARAAMEKLAGPLREIPVRLQRLKKSAMRKLSRTDVDSRFLPDRRGFTRGYTVAVSDDHLLVAQQVSRELHDNGWLVPMVARVPRECGEPPGQMPADSGFFSLHNLEVMEERGIDGYVPDGNMACVLHPETTYASCAPPAHEKQVSFDDRTSVIPASKSTGRAGHRDFERAARDAEIPDARAGKSSRGVCPAHHRVAPDTDVAAQSPLKIPRAEEIQTAPGYIFTGTQMDHGNYQKLAMATQLPHRLGTSPITCMNIKTKDLQNGHFVSA
jgi:transposase